MSRFVATLRLAWLVAKRSHMTRDLRKHFVENYVRRHLFRWETEQLRDERIMQKWDAWDTVLPHTQIKRGVDRVEKWRHNDVAHGQMYLYRAKTQQHGQLWFWLHRFDVVTQD